MERILYAALDITLERKFPECLVFLRKLASPDGFPVLVLWRPLASTPELFFGGV